MPSAIKRKEGKKEKGRCRMWSLNSASCAEGDWRHRVPGLYGPSDPGAPHEKSKIAMIAINFAKLFERVSLSLLSLSYHGVSFGIPALSVNNHYHHHHHPFTA